MIVVQYVWRIRKIFLRFGVSAIVVIYFAETVSAESFSRKVVAAPSAGKTTIDLDPLSGLKSIEWRNPL